MKTCGIHGWQCGWLLESGGAWMDLALNGVNERAPFGPASTRFQRRGADGPDADRTNGRWSGANHRLLHEIKPMKLLNGSVSSWT